MARAPKHPPRDLADRLEPYRDDFDRLIAQARAKAPLSHHDYDRLEEAAAAMSAGIRTAFRGSSTR